MKIICLSFLSQFSGVHFNYPKTISPLEFENVLRYGAGAQSTGVMMFTGNSVADDEQKTATMKKVYMEWMNQK